MLKVRIAVLVSGGGTNLQALIDAQKAGIIKSGEIELVVASNDKAYALQRAAAAGIAFSGARGGNRGCRSLEERAGQPEPV